MMTILFAILALMYLIPATLALSRKGDWVRAIVTCVMLVCTVGAVEFWREGIVDDMMLVVFSLIALVFAVATYKRWNVFVNVV